MNQFCLLVDHEGMVSRDIFDVNVFGPATMYDVNPMAGELMQRYTVSLECFRLLPPPATVSTGVAVYGKAGSTTICDRT